MNEHEPVGVRCADCRYQRGSRCHRHPPTVTCDASGYPDTRWPRVNPDDWCGDFGRKYIPCTPEEGRRRIGGPR